MGISSGTRDRTLSFFALSLDKTKAKKAISSAVVPMALAYPLVFSSAGSLSCELEVRLAEDCPPRGGLMFAQTCILLEEPQTFAHRLAIV